MPAFLRSYVANLLSAGVRLIPLGQTDGQFAIAEIEPAVLLASEQGYRVTLDDLGSAGCMVELAQRELREARTTSPGFLQRPADLRPGPFDRSLIVSVSQSRNPPTKAPLFLPRRVRRGRCSSSLALPPPRTMYSG